MRKLIALIGVMLLSLASPIAFASKESPKKKKKKTVFVKEIASSEIFDTYTYPARVMPTVNSVSLSESQGVVQKINFRLGQKVKQGQIIAKIKHTDPVFKYRPVNLKAQVSGVISKVFVSEGSLVSKGEKILMITDPSKHKILIEVAARDLGYLKADLAGELKLKGKKNVAVKILGISPFVDPATGSASAELVATATDSELVIGSLGMVEFKSNIHNAIVLPEHAILHRGKKTFVRVLGKGNIVKRLEVQLGEKRRGIVEILSGLEAKQIVVERASGFLADGVEVIVKNPAAEKAKAEAKAKETKAKGTKAEAKSKVKKS